MSGRVRTLAFLILGCAIALAAYWHFRQSSGTQALATLDPALVTIDHPKGGLMVVATLRRNEEFKIRQTRRCWVWECPFVGTRIAQVRVPVVYTYTVPLAEKWRLELQGESYLLQLPAPQPLRPPAIRFDEAEFTSLRGGPLPPNEAASQRLLLKHLVPEIERRADRTEYLQSIAPAAVLAVQEFSQTWLRDQRKSNKPVRVQFEFPAAN